MSNESRPRHRFTSAFIIRHSVFDIRPFVKGSGVGGLHKRLRLVLASPFLVVYHIAGLCRALKEQTLPHIFVARSHAPADYHRPQSRRR
jgi:hypothetical protein